MTTGLDVLTSKLDRHDQRRMQAAELLRDAWREPAVEVLPGRALDRPMVRGGEPSDPTGAAAERGLNTRHRELAALGEIVQDAGKLARNAGLPMPAVLEHALQTVLGPDADRRAASFNDADTLIVLHGSMWRALESLTRVMIRRIDRWSIDAVERRVEQLGVHVADFAGHARRVHASWVCPPPDPRPPASVCDDRYGRGCERSFRPSEKRPSTTCRACEKWAHEQRRRIVEEAECEQVR